MSAWVPRGAGLSGAGPPAAGRRTGAAAGPLPAGAGSWTGSGACGARSFLHHALCGCEPSSVNQPVGSAGICAKPAGHGISASLPSAQWLPAPHATGSVVPTLGHELPAGQGVSSALPSAQNEPLPHCCRVVGVEQA